MGVALGQRDVGFAVDCSGEEGAVYLTQLETIVREQQVGTDALERESLAEKHVVHSRGSISGDFEMGVLAAMKLNHAVRGQVWRLPKFVRSNRPGQLRINPIDDFGRPQTGFYVGD